MERKIVLSLFIFGVILAASAVEQSQKKKSWKEKDIRDMNDADLEHLLEQWEENDDPLEPDELPEYMRPSPQIDLSKLDPSDPDNLLKITKRGKSIMMFVDVIPEISDEEAETTMRIWQTSLQNNHIIAERYPIDTKRSIFMFREGSQVVDAKNYLLEQPQLYRVTLEGQTFHRNAKDQVAYDEEIKRKSTQTKSKTEL